MERKVEYLRDEDGEIIARVVEPERRFHVKPWQYALVLVAAFAVLKYCGGCKADDGLSSRGENGSKVVKMATFMESDMGSGCVLYRVTTDPGVTIYACACYGVNGSRNCGVTSR